VRMRHQSQITMKAAPAAEMLAAPRPSSLAKTASADGPVDGLAGVGSTAGTGKGGGGIGKKDEADKKVKEKGTACNVSVKVDKAEGAGDTQALRALVERAARAVACAASGPTKLRIVLDGEGKIAKVDIVSGDRKAGEALVRKLVGATSATRATGKQATVEVTITVGS